MDKEGLSTSDSPPLPETPGKHAKAGGSHFSKVKALPAPLRLSFPGASVPDKCQQVLLGEPGIQCPWGDRPKGTECSGCLSCWGEGNVQKLTWLVFLHLLFSEFVWCKV